MSGGGILEGVNVADLPTLRMTAAEFDLLIADQGSSGELRRSLPCPCARIDTKTPAGDCPRCHGTGRTYPKTLREPMMWLDQQRQATMKLAAVGAIPDGTIHLTFPSGYVPGFGDMVLPDDEAHVVVELLFRDSTRRVFDRDLSVYRDSTDQRKMPQTERLERLLYPVPCCIEFVGIEDEATRELVEVSPHDYTIDRDGRWTWHKGCGPESGKAWAVRYRAPAIYVVHTSAPRFREVGNQRMPHLVTAKRLDVFAAEELRQ